MYHIACAAVVSVASRSGNTSRAEANIPIHHRLANCRGKKRMLVTVSYIVACYQTAPPAWRLIIDSAVLAYLAMASHRIIPYHRLRTGLPVGQATMRGMHVQNSSAET